MSITLQSFQQSINSHLQQCQQFQLEAIESIQQCESIRNLHSINIAKAKSQIVLAFANIQNQLTSQRDKYLKELESMNQSPITSQTYSQISNVTSIINDCKSHLLSFHKMSCMLPNYQPTEQILNEITTSFETAKQEYNKHISTLNSSLSSINIAPIKVNIDQERMKQILARSQRICSISNSMTEEKQQNAQKTDDNKDEKEESKDITISSTEMGDDGDEDGDKKIDPKAEELEDRVIELENRLEKERERYQLVTQQLLSKIGKYLRMENDRGVFWYDANCMIEDKDYQNWDAVLCGNDGMIDTKGKFRRLPEDEGMLMLQPTCKDLGEFHVCIAKLRSGCIKWLEMQRDGYIVEDKGGSGGGGGGGDRIGNQGGIRNGSGDDGGRSNKSPNRHRNRRSDAEEWVRDYAERNDMKQPQVKIINYGRKNENAVVEIIFNGQTFRSEARRRKGAIKMCFKMAMNYIINTGR